MGYFGLLWGFVAPYVAILEPSEKSTSSLIKYIDFMRKMSKSSGDFNFYDEHFRHAQASCLRPWGLPDQL